MKTNLIKPKLVDHRIFEKKVVFKKINPIEIYEKKIFYLNLIMLLIIIIGILFLYYRYENKESEKKKIEQKIKDLYKKMEEY
jgi:cell division protein FtsL